MGWAPGLMLQRPLLLWGLSQRRSRHLPALIGASGGLQGPSGVSPVSHAVAQPGLQWLTPSGTQGRWLSALRLRSCEPVCMSISPTLAGMRWAWGVASHGSAMTVMGTILYLPISPLSHVLHVLCPICSTWQVRNSPGRLNHSLEVAESHPEPTCSLHNSPASPARHPPIAV